MRTFAEISRARLTGNFTSIRTALGADVEILAVVKSDAYGHGAPEVAQTLERAGAHWFGVSSVDEAIELRQSGIAARIIILSAWEKDELDAAGELGLTPVAHSPSQIRDLQKWARKRGTRMRLHVAVDSGMGRLGLPESLVSEAVELLRSEPSLEVEAISTHLASAEDLASPQTDDQLSRLDRMVEQFRTGGIRPRYIHAANSAAVVYRRNSWHSMVRCGLALYGYVLPPIGNPPVAPPPLDLHPILTWKARIIVVKEYPAGVPLGYGATYRTPRPMRVGVAAVGYADGLDRRLSNGGVMLADGRPVPIVGLVSMDLTMVDLTGIPQMAEGKYLTVLGEDGGSREDAMEVAARCHTVPYEILCGIGKRVRRIYT